MNGKATFSPTHKLCHWAAGHVRCHLYRCLWYSALFPVWLQCPCCPDGAEHLPVSSLQMLEELLFSLLWYRHWVLFSCGAGEVWVIPSSRACLIQRWNRTRLHKRETPRVLSLQPCRMHSNSHTCVEQGRLLRSLALPRWRALGWERVRARLSALSPPPTVVGLCPSWHGFWEQQSSAVTETTKQQITNIKMLDGGT